MRTGVIILAAGQGRRMGRNKMIAMLHGEPMIHHVVDAVLAAHLPPPLVVLGHEADLVAAALEGEPHVPVLAEDHAGGMAHSIRAGIAAVPDDWDAVIIALGDMPLVPPQLFSKLAKCAHPGAVVLPEYRGQRGNPVLWGRAHFAALSVLEGDKGARDLLSALGDLVVRIDWSDDTILRDADTPDALAAMGG